MITLQTDLVSKYHLGLVEMLRREPRKDIALERARGETAHPLCVLLSVFESFGPGAHERRRRNGTSDSCSPPSAHRRSETSNENRSERDGALIVYNALVEPRPAEEIARHCGVSKATVHAVISRYSRLGVAAIETKGQGGRRRQYLTLEEEQDFLAPFFAQAESGEIATVGQICQAYAQRIGHNVDDSTIYRLLHRHGWRKLMPRPSHPKSDPETQEQFKKTFPPKWKQPSPRERQEMSGKSLIIAQDEGCFGRISRAKRCWAPPGLRPHAPTQVVREYLYAYAAVAPALGQMVSLILPEASTAMMNRFLEEVSRVFSTYFIVMQVDGAGWHRANDLVVPENIRLIPQPAYSPELNPVEHIWDELREKYFHNRCFASLECVTEALCQGLTALAENCECLRSLTNFPISMFDIRLRNGISIHTHRVRRDERDLRAQKAEDLDERGSVLDARQVVKDIGAGKDDGGRQDLLRGIFRPLNRDVPTQRETALNEIFAHR